VLINVLLLVNELYIRMHGATITIKKSHWFILQQLCRNSLLCDEDFVQIYWALRKAEFNSYIGWFVIIQPGCFIFFGYSCHLLMSNRNSFDTELMLSNINGSQPVNRGIGSPTGLFEAKRKLA